MHPEQVQGAASFAYRLQSLGEPAMSGDALVTAFLKLGVSESSQYLTQEQLADVLRKHLHEALVAQAEDLVHNYQQLAVLNNKADALDSQAQSKTDQAAQQLDTAIDNANKAKAGPADRPKSDAELESYLIDQIRQSSPAEADRLEAEKVTNDDGSDNGRPTLSEVIQSAGQSCSQTQGQAISAKLDEWFPNDSASIRATLTDAGDSALAANDARGATSNIGGRLQSMEGYLSDPHGTLLRHNKHAALTAQLSEVISSIVGQGRPDQAIKKDSLAKMDAHRNEVGKLIVNLIDRNNALSAAQKKDFRG